MDNELKPCPFCGGEATLWKIRETDGPYYRPYHILCGCGGRVGWFEEKKEAIDAWNRRVNDGCSQ
jgi:Lar family restriction alleviation protein